MKNEYLIAQRLYYNPDAHRQARPAIRVALIGMTIGITVILLTFAVVFGFKNAVTEKAGIWQGKHMRPALYRVLERLRKKAESH